MKKALISALAVAAFVAIALVAGRTTAAPAATKDTAITGTGSSFVFPLVSKWIPEVGKAYGINLTYSPTGSGAGIAGVTSRTVDFGASDAPLSSDQLAACKGCVVIPWALSATSIPYNVPGAGGRIKLDGATLANIYLGKITTWNAPAIKKMNPSLNLPDLKITPVFRSDSSGTTYNFTEYLSSVSGEFKSKVGNNTAVNFPTGVGARGSAGVAGVVSKTEGALTYVDVAYSLTNKLTFASIRNRAGGFALPGLRGIKQAVSQLPKKVTNLTQLKIVDPPKSAGKQAYPISTFTYVIVPTNSKSAGDVRKLVYWAVTQGQKFGPPLLFEPLPVTVQAFAYREIKKIQGV
ncbi:MAG TPA: phosphate ABC transporter substrate-binding protein PstS [Gaiella sp.]